MTSTYADISYFTHAVALFIHDHSYILQVVNWDTYNRELEALGLLVKARNFLVFQVCASDDVVAAVVVVVVFVL